MSPFFFAVGRSIRIPILDPENEVYLERVRFLISAVSGFVERWDLFHDPSTTHSSLPGRLAYSLRKLAEMLSSDDIQRIKEQEFLQKAHILMVNSSEGLWEREMTENAMEILCEGFAGIQNRMDYGASPFETTTETKVEISQCGRKSFDSVKMATFPELKDRTSLVLAN